jgi:hypothetical protein
MQTVFTLMPKASRNIFQPHYHLYDVDTVRLYG